jgi:hypothetical protein
MVASTARSTATFMRPILCSCTTLYALATVQSSLQRITWCTLAVSVVCNPMVIDDDGAGCARKTRHISIHAPRAAPAREFDTSSSRALLRLTFAMQAGPELPLLLLRASSGRCLRTQLN